MGAISYIHLNLEISGMALTHAILTALLEEDLTGYELAKQFDVSLGFFWTASHQQIYQTLWFLQPVNEAFLLSPPQLASLQYLVLKLEIKEKLIY